MSNKLGPPEPGRKIEVRLERCWEQTRNEDNRALFYRIPMAALRKVAGNREVIFPNLVGYAIIPIEDYNTLLLNVRHRGLSDRLNHYRSAFLRWFQEVWKVN